MSPRPPYLRVLLTFARNSLVRDMTFRTNFILQCVSAISWTAMNVGFYEIVFRHTRQIGLDSGWGKWEFFVFLATTWVINSLVQAFFMPNCQEFSELIRTGGLDFALLKPIDTQFLVSFQKVEWSSLSNLVVGVGLLAISLTQLTGREHPLALSPWMVLLYLFYVACGVAIMYSVMISLSATSIWLGRNQTLYNFWFYITNFARYPMEIYYRGWGKILYVLFTFIIPVLVVVNVPARLLAQPLTPRPNWEWQLAVFALFAAVGSLLASRVVFQLALRSYRSASS
ncbi:MAG: ABC-2 family transporter protein [Planctomycetales bacterium]|nr:ABC-2 family transporter protein [Planctomycetales bacterium]